MTLFFKVKKYSFGIGKRFYKIKRHRSKNKREIEELFSKTIILSIDGMGNFQEKEMNKKRIFSWDRIKYSTRK